MIQVENAGEKEAGKKHGPTKAGELHGKGSQDDGRNWKKEHYERRIAEVERAAEEYKETLQRVQAEFENAGKRSEREKAEFVKFAAAKTIEEFLPLADSIDEGIRQAEKSGNKEMKLGLEVIRTQFVKALEANGVRRIEAVGKKFDHSLHEVLMTTKEDSMEDGYVLEEFQKGYTLNGKVLRPAKVKINRKD